MKKSGGLVLACFAVAIFAGCGGDDEDASVEVDIEIRPEGPVHLDVGEVLTLEVRVEGADEEGLEWQNERRTVARFDGEETVEALREGYTRIIAGHEDDDSAEAVLEVFVEDRCEEGLCVRPEEAAMHPGGERVFEVVGSGDEEISWSAELGEFVDDGLYVAPEVDVWDDEGGAVDVIRASAAGDEATAEVSIQFWVPIPNEERDPGARIQELVEHPQEERLYIPTSDGIYVLSEVTRAWERIRDTRGGLPQPGVASLAVDGEGALLAEVRDIYRRPPGSESFENLGIGNHPYGMATLGTEVYGARRGDDDSIYRFGEDGEWEPFVSIGHRTRSMSTVGEHVYVRNHGPELVRFDAGGNLEGLGDAESVTEGPDGGVYAVLDDHMQRFEDGEWVDAGLAEVSMGSHFSHYDGSHWVVERVGQAWRHEDGEWKEYGPPMSGFEGSVSRRAAGPEGRMYAAMSGRNPLDSNEEIYFDVIKSPPYFFGDEAEAATAETVVIKTPPYDILKVGRELPLRGEVEWSDGRVDQGLHWISSDTRVARVDRRGRIDAIAPGEATIRARARGDLEVYDELSIAVVDDPPEPVALHIDPAPVELMEGDGLQLKAQVEWRRFFDSARFADDVSVQWSVGDEEVARVGSDGHLEGRSPGETTVEAVLVDWPEIEASAGVEVMSTGGL